MANAVTLANIRTQVRQRSDTENSQFVTDAELNTLINSGIRTLYDMLLAAAEDYYTISDTIVCDGVANAFDLPADFYKLMGVDYLLNGINSPMEKFVFQDRHKYIYNTEVLRYRIVANQIRFAPLPPAQTITIWYAPAPVDLALDADTFDGINGWEDYVIADAAIRVLIKEEQDSSQLERELAGIAQRVEQMKQARDQGLPEKVQDVRSALRYPWIYIGGR